MATTVVSRFLAYASLAGLLTCTAVHALESPATAQGSTAGQPAGAAGGAKKDDRKSDPRKSEKGEKGAESGSGASGSGGGGSAPTVGTVQCPKQAELNGVHVTAAHNRQTKEKLVQLGDELVVQVADLKFLMDAAKCQKPQKKVLLYLDGRPITNLSPEPPTDPGRNELIFPLKRNDKSREAWNAILGRPRFETRNVGVSAGIEGEHAMPSSVEVDFKVMGGWWFTGWALLVGLVLIGFVIYEKGEMLRVPGPKPEQGAGRSAPTKAFSLSRVQMAWWTLLTLAAYGFIGIITGDWASSITGSVLVLVGLSAGTIAAASAIDRGDAKRVATEGKALITPRSEGMWTDIVSDGEDVSIHRYQMAVWTIVLGIIFVITVYIELAMPTFSDTLLALMGISAGTYVGVKTVEAKPPTKPADKAKE